MYWQLAPSTCPTETPGYINDQYSYTCFASFHVENKTILCRRFFKYYDHDYSEEVTVQYSDPPATSRRPEDMANNKTEYGDYQPLDKPGKKKKG